MSYIAGREMVVARGAASGWGQRAPLWVEPGFSVGMCGIGGFWILDGVEARG
jgi:hypothetical protein